MKTLKLTQTTLMPRIARAIAVGCPHHITQRGNYRQTVFAGAEDYARFLEVLVRCAPQNDLEIWAYCLMPNHVHLVGVPQRQDSLARVSIYAVMEVLKSMGPNLGRPYVDSVKGSRHDFAGKHRNGF